MSLPFCIRVRKFSSFLNYFSQRYSKTVPFKKRLFFKQQVNVCRLSYSCHSTHTGYIKLGVDNVSADYDPDLHAFNDAYELVRKAICHTENKAIIDVMNWNAKVLDYNVQDGKKIRGLTVLKGYKILSDEGFSSDKALQACILGWCLELLQGFFLVTDDIMDNSTTRRGKPCWYKLPDVGIIAVNDALMLEHGIYKILEMYFGKSEAYYKIIHEFLQTTQKTVYGQCLDMLSVPPNAQPRFEIFNLEKYYAIVEYKTAYYTFCLPVHLAMLLVENFSKQEFEETRSICLKMGRLLQVQDDFLDVYGDPSITGKIGTDIIDGKCNWFSAYVFQHAPESKKKIMLENYGVNTEEAVSNVLKLYDDLKLVEKYHDCEESMMKEITVMVENLSKNSLKQLFYILLKKIYHRKK